MSDIDGHNDIPEVTLGWRLRIAMERAGLEAQDMADQLGVHRGTISRWTHDNGSPPRAIYIERWAALCGVAYNWLAGDSPGRPFVRSTSATSLNRRVKTPSTRGCLSSTRRRVWSPSVTCLPVAA